MRIVGLGVTMAALGSPGADSHFLKHLHVNVGDESKLLGMFKHRIPGETWCCIVVSRVESLGFHATDSEVLEDISQQEDVCLEI